MIVTNLASLTNQRLDSAKRLIDLSCDSKEEWLNAGLEGSAIFHIMSAFNSFLKEICLAYSLPNTLDVESLLVEAENKQIVIPALNELSSLLKKRESWCSQLHQSYYGYFECNVLPVGHSDHNIIGRGSDSGASSNMYLAELSELILRFREESSEY